MKVLGLMSGTSMDGIDAAAVELERTADGIGCRLLGFASTPYAPDLVRRLRRQQTPEGDWLAEASSLNFEIGAAFAQSALQVLRRVDGIALIGSHGQTLFHEPRPQPDSRRAPSTLQLGEPAVIAERTGLTVVADFRVADVAAGGHGAPLVSFVDHLMLRSAAQTRAALNIGGVANVTLLPKGGTMRDVRAFDTGPGNMLIDAAMRALFPASEGLDRDGAVAASGAVDERMLAGLLANPYFAMEPPKTAGREQFGEPCLREALARATALGVQPRDVIATLTELTARTVADAIPQDCALVIVSGGGAHNRTLVARIRDRLHGRPQSVRLVFSDRFGLDVDAKEAIAFAILAFEAVHGRANVLPSVTGAGRAAVLGKIVPGSNFTDLMRSVWQTRI
jgi:anhydro-N-acetylmuramic acid kinase